MVEGITLGLVSGLIAIVIPIFIKFEHRMTILEGKMDVLLNHNGIGTKTKTPHRTEGG